MVEGRRNDFRKDGLPDPLGGHLEVSESLANGLSKGLLLIVIGAALSRRSIRAVAVQRYYQTAN